MDATHEQRGRLDKRAVILIALACTAALAQVTRHLLSDNASATDRESDSPRRGGGRSTVPGAPARGNADAPGVQMTFTLRHPEAAAEEDAPAPRLAAHLNESMNPATSTPLPIPATLEDWSSVP